MPAVPASRTRPAFGHIHAERWHRPGAGRGRGVPAGRSSTASFRNPARCTTSLGIPVLETIGEIAVGSFWAKIGLQLVLPFTAAVQVALILLLM